MSRKLKKYNLKYEYLKLEKEDVESDFWAFVKDFEKHFNKYYERPKKGSPTANERHVWVNEETGEVRHEPPETSFDDMFKANKDVEDKKEAARIKHLEELKSRPEKLKRLYKRIAIKTHPDRGGDDNEFQEVNNAFNKLDLATLLNYAGKYDIDYEVGDDDVEILEKNLTELESEINDFKSKLAWKWGTGDKKARMEVIDTIKYQTGWQVEDSDLPDDLRQLPDEPKLLDEKHLDNSE